MLQNSAKLRYICSKKHKKPLRAARHGFLGDVKLTQTMATLLFTVALLLVAVLLLGVKIFFTRGGRFPNTHIHSNPEMRKRGITCANDSNFFN